MKFHQGSKNIYGGLLRIPVSIKDTWVKAMYSMCIRACNYWIYKCTFKKICAILNHSSNLSKITYGHKLLRKSTTNLAISSVEQQ